MCCCSRERGRTRWTFDTLYSPCGSAYPEYLGVEFLCVVVPESACAAEHEYGAQSRIKMCLSKIDREVGMVPGPYIVKRPDQKYRITQDLRR